MIANEHLKNIYLFRNVSEANWPEYVYSGLLAESVEAWQLYVREMYGKPLNVEDLVSELGDVLYFITAALDLIPTREIKFDHAEKYKTSKDAAWNLVTLAFAAKVLFEYDEVFTAAPIITGMISALNYLCKENDLTPGELADKNVEKISKRFAKKRLTEEEIDHLHIIKMMSDDTRLMAVNINMECVKKLMQDGLVTRDDNNTTYRLTKVGMWCYEASSD